MHGSEIWTYRKTAGPATDQLDVVAGYDVEALDGSIGEVDEATFDASIAYIVVDTGPWIFGKKVMLPAGIVREVDHDEEKVYVNRTKQQIKDAPEFADSLVGDDEYIGRLGDYYGTGPGYRESDGNESRR